MSAHLFSINDYVTYIHSSILYCDTDMYNKLYISVENKVILCASKFAPMTFCTATIFSVIIFSSNIQCMIHICNTIQY